MVKKWWFVLGGCVALVTAFVFAGIGSAGSKNVCAIHSDLTKNASCVGQSVLPHFITAASTPSDPTTWSEAISTTKFTNEAGLGGATATHVMISVTWPANSAFVRSTKLFANGTEITDPARTTPETPTTHSSHGTHLRSTAGTGTSGEAVST